MEKVAIVTGSSTGIGFETSLALAREGYITYATMRDVKKADLKLNALFNKGLRKRKIFKASAKLYPSLAITDEDLYNTKEAIHDAVLNLV